MKNSFFILGNPRSGTSLMRIILNNHINLVVPPECGFVQWLYIQYSLWDQSSNNQEYVQVFLDDLFLTKKFETWRLNKKKLLDHILRVQPNDYTELCETIYCYYGDVSSGCKKDIKLWGDKNNYYIHHLEELKDIISNAEYIHLVRDGRDVACSYLDLNQEAMSSKYYPSLTKDVAEIAREWDTNNLKIDNFLSMISVDNKLVIHFEDLIMNTKNTLLKICKYLKVDFDEKMLIYYRPGNALGEPDELLRWKQKTLQPPDEQAIGRYKAILSIPEIRLFEKIASSGLNRYNYLK
jgi:hypothetical protein